MRINDDKRFFLRGTGEVIKEKLPITSKREKK